MGIVENVSAQRCLVSQDDDRFVAIGAATCIVLIAIRDQQ
jgi:hypothetical protein